MWGGMWSKAKEGINEEDYYRECAQKRGLIPGAGQSGVVCTCVLYLTSSPALSAAAVCLSRNGDGLGLP